MKNDKDSFFVYFRFVLFAYIFTIPLGQLLKIPINLTGDLILVNVADIIVLLCIPLFLIIKPKNTTLYKPLLDFGAVIIFSFVVAISTLGLKEVFFGSFYLMRFFGYLSFSILIYHYLSKKLINRNFVLYILIISLIFTAVLGWIQYLFIPDLRFLRLFGWDDHLYRLAGTYLDPSFTALILLAGFAISISQFINNKNIKYLILSLFFSATIMFTYSRVGMLSLICTLIYLLIKKRILSLKLILTTVIALIFIIVALPKREGEGTDLLRTQSIEAKFANFRQTLTIAEKYPVFGVGFDNLCVSRTRLLGGDSKSHACSGSDSSLLFVFVTTGIVGFMIFAFSILKIRESINEDYWGLLLKTLFVGVLVHSLFVQSMFYSFTLGILGILFAFVKPKD